MVSAGDAWGVTTNMALALGKPTTAAIELRCSPAYLLRLGRTSLPSAAPLHQNRGAHSREAHPNMVSDAMLGRDCPRARADRRPLELQITASACCRPRLPPYCRLAPELSIPAQLGRLCRSYVARCPACWPGWHALRERRLAAPSRHSSYLPYCATHSTVPYPAMASKHR